jgi:hypothetical protein
MTTTPARRSSSRGVAAAILIALAAAACSAGRAQPAAPTESPACCEEPSGGITPFPEITLKPGISRAPGVGGLPDPSAGEGVPPEVVQAAVDDAASRTGVVATEVTVVSSQSVTWPNPALGCPRRGVMYADVITPGYRVVVEAGGTSYDYRADQQGNISWCEDPPGPG